MGGPGSGPGPRPGQGKGKKKKSMGLRGWRGMKMSSTVKLNKGKAGKKKLKSLLASKGLW